MTAVELLRELSGRGVRVRVTGDRLRLRGPQNVLTQNLTERLREHKQAILEVIRSQPACGECGAAILEQPAWWGGKSVHADCGRRAWARQWQGETLSADTPCALVH